MTAVCALVHAQKVWVGADSAGVSGYSLTMRQDLKVFVNRDMVFGFTTSFRMGQLLRWSFDPPTQGEGEEDERYMSTRFVDSVRGCLKDGGYATKQNEGEKGGNFIVGYHGKIWNVGGDYQVGQALARYDAIGSGTDLLLGSLHASDTFPGSSPQARLLLALQAAEDFNSTVRGPFTVIREP